MSPATLDGGFREVHDGKQVQGYWLRTSISDKTLKNRQTHSSMNMVFCDSVLLPRFGHDHL